LRSFSAEQVRLAVLPTDKTTVTEKGIRFKGMYYSSDRAASESWFAKARSKKRWSVSVSYDPRDMAVIYVQNDGGGVYDTCTLIDWNAKNAGKCLEEIVYEQGKEKIAAKQLKSAEIEAKVNLNAEIEAIAAEAEAQSKGLPAKSNRERVSNVKGNRRTEREAVQAAVAAEETLPELTTPTGAPASENEMSPMLSKIRRKMEERLKNE
jgi:hypothetical protein